MSDQNCCAVSLREFLSKQLRIKMTSFPLDPVTAEIQANVMKTGTLRRPRLARFQAGIILIEPRIHL